MTTKSLFQPLTTKRARKSKRLFAQIKKSFGPIEGNKQHRAQAFGCLLVIFRPL
jgi:hypothetical protein